MAGKGLGRGWAGILPLPLTVHVISANAGSEEWGGEGCGGSGSGGFGTYNLRCPTPIWKGSC